MKRLAALLIVAIMFVATLSVAAAPKPAKASPYKLSILTAHVSGIYSGYVKAFVSWAQSQGWEITEADVNVESLPGEVCLQRLQAAWPNPTWDVWWGGGVALFLVGKSQGLLDYYNLTAWSQYNENASGLIPDQLYGYLLKDLEGFWFGSAISGFGIMVNKEYLAEKRLTKPIQWEDLTSPIYKGHIVISTPARSSSTHQIFEILLQGLGWERGWLISSEIVANVGFFTERSSHVPARVSTGEYGIGAVIDFYGLGAVLAGHPVEFAYPPGETIFNPDSIALVKNAPSKLWGERFISYVLSNQGQALWLAPEVTEHRLPVRPDAYTVYPLPEGFFNPFTTTVEVKWTVDFEKQATRDAIVNDLFDSQIFDRHRELLDAWNILTAVNASINEAEAEGFNVTDARQKWREAEAILGSMPVTEAWAAENGRNYATDASLRASLKAAWDTFAVGKYRNATLMAQEAEEILKTSRAATLTALQAQVAQLQTRVNDLQATATSNLYLGLGAGLILGLVVGVAVTWVARKPKAT